MEHWIKITPDEEEPPPFIIYFPRRSAMLPAPQTPTGIFTTRAHYGNQTVCVYRNQSTGKPWQRVMTVQSLFVTFLINEIFTMGPLENEEGTRWTWGVNPKISI